MPLDNNKILNLSFWDTSGQEKYHALNKIYYKDAKIVILVYDITKRKTFPLSLYETVFIDDDTNCNSYVGFFLYY